MRLTFPFFSQTLSAPSLSVACGDTLAESTQLGIGEFGPDLRAETPDDAAFALAMNRIRELDDELRRHVDAFGEQAHAAVGNIGDQALARQRSQSPLDSHHTSDGMPRRSASITGRSRHESAFLVVEGRPTKP